MQQNADIHAQARRIETMAPRLTTGVTLSPKLRIECEELAALCGMPLSARQAATDNDLISILLVAKRDAAAGTRVAERVTKRLTNDPFGFTAPEPEPAPAPSTTQPGVSMEDVQRAIRAAVRPLEEQFSLVPTSEAVQNDLRALSERIDTLADVAADTAAKALESRIAEAAAEAVRALQPTRIEIVKPNAPPVVLGLAHAKTPQLLAMLTAGVNAYLHGPAGSGKTTSASMCAKALGVSFYFAAKVESEYQLMGFKDARGETVRTQFREAYEHGGVFLFDEMDASSPSAVVALNAALANGVCPFPDAIVKRHAEFYCIGAGNTKLTGATRQYAGRSQLDAASIDRFAFIEWDYDDELERALASNGEWCAYVQAVRKAVKDRGLPHLVTPRATYDGCKLLAAGMDWVAVAAAVVYKGLDSDTVRQIEQAVTVRRPRAAQAA